MSGAPGPGRYNYHRSALAVQLDHLFDSSPSPLQGGRGTPYPSISDSPAQVLRFTSLGIVRRPLACNCAHSCSFAAIGTTSSSRALSSRQAAVVEPNGAKPGQASVP